MRVVFSYKMGFAAVRQARRKNTLPLILGAVALPAMVMGQTSQPTALGFLILSVGLMLSSFNVTPVWPRPVAVPYPSYA